ncbi:hypothetical protein QE390_000835 [Siphonobacter sp. SORGH_AS 1065]|nr:hypothetical protein [Siphonobacter sp. SORGH_AS_1065]
MKSMVNTSGSYTFLTQTNRHLDSIFIVETRLHRVWPGDESNVGVLKTTPYSEASALVSVLTNYC